MIHFADVQEADTTLIYCCTYPKIEEISILISMETRDVEAFSPLISVETKDVEVL